MIDDTHSDEIDQTVMTTLRTKDHSALAVQVDALNLTQNSIIELLAYYMVLSEQDNDDRFDNWFDGLSKEQHIILKTFEVYRGHYEHQD
ncbi:hypothetical protein [Pseudoalteromonas mariniglutinosa]|uniref:hypothetical protein n=1 Tax=Pseudoalteromonas mariniglutinosa TaxID=206042 RepID=UPI00384C3B7F